MFVFKGSSKQLTAFSQQLEMWPGVATLTLNLFNAPLLGFSVIPHCTTSLNPTIYKTAILLSSKKSLFSKAQSLLCQIITNPFSFPLQSDTKQFPSTSDVVPFTSSLLQSILQIKDEHMFLLPPIKKVLRYSFVQHHRQQDILIPRGAGTLCKIKSNAIPLRNPVFKTSADRSLSCNTGNIKLLQL